MKKIMLFILCTMIFFGMYPLFTGNQNIPAAHNVYVGKYLVDISAFDLTDGCLNADFYLWCKWFGTSDIPPIHFANGEINTMEALSHEDEDNWHSVRWHVQGTFRGTFPLYNFPFDTQTLNLEIGLESDGGNPLPDLAGSGMSDSFSITGWLYAPYFTR